MTAVTERDMLNLLNARYSKSYRNGQSLMHRYTRAEHVRSQLGFDAPRTADYMAVDLWGTIGPVEKRGPFVHCHEVKVSRSDWLTELKDPDKAGAFKPFVHYFWLVAADKDIVRGDLPDDWGLMVKQGNGLRVIVPAPKLNPQPMPLTMHGSLLRATAKTAERFGREKLLSEQAADSGPP